MGVLLYESLEKITAHVCSEKFHYLRKRAVFLWLLCGMQVKNTIWCLLDSLSQIGKYQCCTDSGIKKEHLA